MNEHSFWVVVVVVVVVMVVMGFRHGCTHARAHTRALGALYTLVMSAFATRAFPCARARTRTRASRRASRRGAAPPALLAWRGLYKQACRRRGVTLYSSHW